LLETKHYLLETEQKANRTKRQMRVNA